jgi:hypothetical protein
MKDYIKNTLRKHLLVENIDNNIFELKIYCVLLSTEENIDIILVTV